MAGDDKNKVVIPYRKDGVKAPSFLTGFTFLYEKDIDYHNNHIEQLIRPDVIFRKITFGDRSSKGEEIIMS